MRYRVAALLLLAGLSAMHVFAAPAPEPYAILDIGPPRNGEQLEEHRNDEMGRLVHPYGVLARAWRDPEVKQLRLIVAVDARFDNPRQWLSKQFRIANEDGGTRLRVTFRGGDRQEQVVMINALLRSYMREHGKYLRRHEEILRRYEKGLPKLIKLVDSPPDPRQVDCNKKELAVLRAELPKKRALVAACKQVAVIKWAK
jgi:hypothetical protein